LDTNIATMNNQKYDLTIKPLPTSKDGIYQRPLMESGVIPQVNTVSMIVGKSGSGKTCLLCNLLQRPEFYGPDNTGTPYFDQTIIFSTTGGTALDNTYDSVSWLKSDNFEHEFKPEYITGLIESQKKHINQHGFGKRKLLIIFDDILSQPKFIKSKEFLKCFVELRHFCCTVIVNTQSYTRIPRACRLQTTCLFFFPSSMSEQEVLADNVCPPNMSKKRFIELIQYATDKPYNFLYINNKLPINERFRKNLDKIISY